VEPAALTAAIQIINDGLARLATPTEPAAWRPDLHEQTFNDYQSERRA
jgi:hypothetical protein